MTVCVANRISGRQQKPVALREQNHPTTYRRNPLPLGRGGCQHRKSDAMMYVMDAVNNKFGRGAIQLAAQGFEQQWHMQSNNKSPSYTTQWDHLVFVSAS